MDASYKIQRGIHVHLIQFFMCPEFWVHIIILPRFLNVANVILEGKRLVRPLQWSVSRGGQASLSAGADFLLQPSPWMTWRETVL